MDFNHIFTLAQDPDNAPTRIGWLSGPVVAALRAGIELGRGGLGAIYVKSAGNGGIFTDNCAFDEACNSIYTVTVGAIDRRDRALPNSETCTSVLVSAYSAMGDRDGLPSISKSGDRCEKNMQGTGAATALVSGALALALQAR